MLNGQKQHATPPTRAVTSQVTTKESDTHPPIRPPVLPPTEQSGTTLGPYRHVQSDTPPQTPTVSPPTSTLRPPVLLLTEQSDTNPWPLQALPDTQSHPTPPKPHPPPPSTPHSTHYPPPPPPSAHLCCQLLLHWCVCVAVADHVVDEADGLGGPAAKGTGRDGVHTHLPPQRYTHSGLVRW